VSSPLQVVFVSGLSGSGKTTVMATLEDLGFYSVDNLPAQLTRQFLDLCVAARPPIRRVALAIDTREAAFLRAVPAVIEDLRRRDLDVRVLFLDCATDVLVHRYRETRRVHPLSPGGSVEQGVEIERQLLLEIAELADLRLDTSELNVHELRETVARAMAGQGRVALFPRQRRIRKMAHCNSQGSVIVSLQDGGRHPQTRYLQQPNQRISGTSGFVSPWPSSGARYRRQRAHVIQLILRMDLIDRRARPDH